MYSLPWLLIEISLPTSNPFDPLPPFSGCHLALELRNIDYARSCNYQINNVPCNWHQLILRPPPTATLCELLSPCHCWADSGKLLWASSWSRLSDIWLPWNHRRLNAPLRSHQYAGAVIRVIIWRSTCRRSPRDRKAMDTWQAIVLRWHCKNMRTFRRMGTTWSAAYIFIYSSVSCICTIPRHSVRSGFCNSERVE